MPEITEKQAKMLANIEEADVVILLDKGAMAGVAWFKGIGRVPSSVEVDYGEADDPPLTIRRVVVRAGWTLDKWRRMDRTGLHEGGEHDAS